MSLFGLIGFPLGHSFSKKYFTEKFSQEKLPHQYQNFELEHIELVQEVMQNPGIKGLNVTIPYKEKILTYLDQIDAKAQAIGAVNVIKINEDGTKKGFNSDYYGFKRSLEGFISSNVKKALVLGTGGASKAITTALRDLSIDHSMVSRDPKKGDLTYDDLHNDTGIIAEHLLIINTTPLGTFPKVDEKPDLPYENFTDRHYFYDLVYNPEETAFMRQGKRRNAHAKNGLEMLELQAEKAWEIWNT